MEKMTTFFLIIIVAYLVYAFIKSRPAKKEEKSVAEAVSTGQQTAEVNEKERAAIVAAIAAVMGEASFAIKRVYAVATVDERASQWRTAGRAEIMSRKI